MQEWIEQQIIDTYRSMTQAIANDDLESASKLQQIIEELKQQLKSI